MPLTYLLCAGKCNFKKFGTSQTTTETGVLTHRHGASDTSTFEMEYDSRSVFPICIVGQILNKNQMKIYVYCHVEFR